MGMEGYQPSEEEVKSAEDTMTEKQTLSSSRRENAYNRAVDEGFTPEQIKNTRLDMEDLPGGNPGNYRILGTIEGHSIEIKAISTDDKKWLPRITGTLDGNQLDENAVREIMQRYNNMIFNPDKDFEKEAEMIIARGILDHINSIIYAMENIQQKSLPN